MMANNSRSGSLAQTKQHIFKEKLLTGEKFLKWTEQDNTSIPVTLKVDPNGYFLYYYDQKDEISLIDFFHIRDIRTGDQAKTPSNQKVKSIVNMGSERLEDKTITIAFGTDFVNVNFIHFCTHKVEYAQFWAKELWDYVRNYCKPLTISSQHNIHKIYTQLLLLTHKPESPLPVKSIVKYFAASKEDRRLVEKALDAAGFSSGKSDTIKKDQFTYEQFQQFYQKLIPRDDLSKIFSYLCQSESSDSNVMSCKKFLSFLNDYQRDPRLNEILYPYATEEKAINLIKKYEPNQHLVSKNQLSCEGFQWFLLSEDNLVLSQERLYKLDNMELPLSHYFIASSHNTYLTGHQLTGRALVEMYRQVLLSGCRCIELDFWDGEEDPIITHGYTIVNKLPAKDVIQAIAECAFKTSDYPLVLSFENHCKFKQQAKIAEYCKEYFGDRMLQYPLSDYPLVPNKPLPSPEALKGKILIKNKKKHLHHSKSHRSSVPVTPSRRTEVRSTNSNPTGPSSPGNDVPDTPNGDYPESDSDSDTDSEDEGDSAEIKEVIPTSEAGTAGKESKACEEISSLVNYVTPVRFRSFKNAESRRRSFEMSSFDEKYATSLLKNDPVDFVKYNKFQTSRIYPKGTRVDSSNYMPHIFWNAGCQFVALNYQNLDIPMQLNLGLFQYNKGTGYILKPDLLCRNDKLFDPFTDTSVDGIVPGTVSLKIISGQLLTDRHVGTFVEVEMYGLPSDTVRKGKCRTRTIQNNINPIFDEEPFVFRQVVMPELAVLRIAAFEESGKLIGQRVLPIIGLCPGYRHIPLFNESGQPLSQPSLFVKIEVGDYVPNAWSELADALSNPIKHQTEKEKRALALEILADECEASETDAKMTGLTPGVSVEDPSSPVHDINTPEAASPTIENLKRAGSNTKKLGSKDGSPVIGPQRTDSNKSLPVNNDGSTNNNASLKNKTLTPATVDEILETKTIKEISAKQKDELDKLKKKLEKDKNKLAEKLTRAPSKTKNPLNRIGAGIKKKFSTVNLDSNTSSSGGKSDSDAKCESLRRSFWEKELNCEKNCLTQEKELREKHLDALYSAAEQVMLKSQSSQLKTLQRLLEQEGSEAIKKIENDYKEDNEKGSLMSISKEDMQRERRAWIVNRGVIEKKKLQEVFNEKEQELKLGHKAVTEELKEKFSQQKIELNKDCELSIKELESKYSEPTHE